MPRMVSLIVTARDTGERMRARAAVPFEDDGGTERAIINIYDDVSFQEVRGFGGAFTEAAALTFYRLPEAARAEVLGAYFDAEKGLGYTLGRTHINSCDFCEGSYASDDVADDAALRHLSLKHERFAMIPFMREARAASRDRLGMIVSPWSPPAWMKSNGEMVNGGKLLAVHRKAWAGYMAAFVAALEAEGIPVWAVTVQNEPKAAQRWESCIYSCFEEKEFVKDELAPAFESLGLSRVRIMIWDHNRERLYERARDAFEDESARERISGVAFHWYSGDHFESLDLVRRFWPEKELIFSEGCREGSPALGDWETGERYGHDLFGCLCHGASAWIDWNLLLDKSGGPNHAGNFCDAPIIADTETGELHYEASYYYLGHFSRFVTPGSVRVGHTSFTDRIEAAAFRRSDGDLVAILMNRGETAIAVNLRNRDQIAPLELPGHSIATALIR
jgi:glucosylceramidase